MTPSPPTSCHQDSVCRSYISRLLWRSAPVVPKSSIAPSTVRLYTKAVLHSGQKVMTTGSPPTVSFTSSCHTITCTG